MYCAHKCLYDLPIFALVDPFNGFTQKQGTVLESGEGHLEKEGGVFGEDEHAIAMDGVARHEVAIPHVPTLKQHFHKWLGDLLQTHKVSIALFNHLQDHLIPLLFEMVLKPHVVSHSL